MKTIKRIFAIILCLILLGGILPSNNTGWLKLPDFLLKSKAAASDYYTYSVSDGKATIINCDEAISGDISIPDTVGGYPVISIGDNAFSFCDILTSIVIPNSVTSIGDSAFSFCENLTDITIPDSVTSIGEYAFSACYNLTSITISNNVTSIGVAAFNSTKYYNTSSNWENGVLYIGRHLIEVTDDISGSYEIKEGTLVIADDTFYDCNSIKSISIPDSVISIGDSAFSFCENLTDITIPDSVTTIGNEAFSGCKNLTSISIPSGVTTIGVGMFRSCENLTSIRTSNNVTSIGDFAFGYCENLGSIAIPNRVTSIGEGAFYNCKSLASINIPNSVTSIGSSAFNGCENLTNISIGDSVTSIGVAAFNLTKYSDTSSNWENGALYIGRYLISATDDISGSYEIKAGTLTIADYAFSGCYHLTNITIPNSVIAIGDAAFYQCGFKIITIPKGVTSIGDFVFYQCDLKSITIPNSVTSIGSFAFYKCDFKKITIPNNVTTIGDSAFKSCENLISITISDSVTSIGDSAFEDCYGLEKVYYRGTYNQKRAILIKDGSDCLASAFWYYNACIGSENHTYDDVCDNECNICGKVIKATHNYENTCDKECNSCGEIREVIHIYKNKEYDENKHFWQCDCGAIDEENVYDHGFTRYYDANSHWLECACGYKKDIEVHDFEWVIDKAGNCGVTGKKHEECKVCDVVRNENTVIAATGKHEYSAVTCTAPKACKVCKAKSGKALGHNYKDVLTKATLTKNGKIVEKCSVCGDVDDTTTIYYAKTVKLSASSYTYNGKAKTPTVTVKDSKGKAISKNYYTVKYASGRKNVGKYKVTVTFKGNYSGTKTLYFTINPPTTSVSKLTAAKKALTVSISKKSSQVTGYEIQYATNKKFTKAKTATIKSYKTTKTTLKKLSAKKTYYVRVRTYKTVSGKKYYSGWSTVKSKKTK